MTKLRGHCPHCFKRAATAINRLGEDRARTGDIGICRGCGGLILFDFNYSNNVCRKPTREQTVEILTNDAYRALHALMTQERVA
jgi:hypothetical protein